MTIKPETINAELRAAIEKNLTAQLLRWDRGETKELFDKKLFGDKQQEAETFLATLVGNHITGKPIKILFGREEYKDVFPWVEDQNVPRGFMVAIVPANTSTLRESISFPMSHGAGEAVTTLKHFLAVVMDYARANEVKGLKTLKGPIGNDSMPESGFSAATAEDFVNGLNVFLDKDLQISPQLARPR